MKPMFFIALVIGSALILYLMFLAIGIASIPINLKAQATEKEKI